MERRRLACIMGRGRLVRIAGYKTAPRAKARGILMPAKAGAPC
jgi:hypothetical protein